MHAVVPFLLEPSASVLEVAITKLQSYKSLGSDQFPRELFPAGGETLRAVIHRHFSGSKKNCLTSGKSLFTRRAIKPTFVINQSYRCFQLLTNLFQHSSL
jgi:hypothetical protein